MCPRTAALAFSLAVISAVGLAIPVTRADAASIAQINTFFGRQVQYTAGSGEANAVTVTQGVGTVTVVDTGLAAPMTDGDGAGGCVPNGSPPYAATCTNTYISVSVSTGDLADTVDASAMTLAVGTTPGTGDDTVIGGAGADTLLSEAGADGQDTFTPNGGDDIFMYARSTSVTISNDGVANDGSPGENDNAGDAEWLVGGSGDDTLIGGSGADLFTGCEGNDVEYGYGGDDTMMDKAIFGCSGGGNDNYYPGTGADTIASEDGSTGAADAVHYEDRTAPVSLSNDGVANDGESGEGDNIDADIEILIGGAGNDWLTGQDNADTLIGNGGNDVISGGGGSDSLIGNDGSDSLQARDGVFDALSCGAGFDTADADSIDSISDCSPTNGDSLYLDGQVVVPGLPGTGGGTGATPGSDAASCSPKPKVKGVKVRRRYAKLTITSSASVECKGKVTLRSRKKIRASKRSKAKRITLGRASYKLGAGASKTVKVKFSRKVQRLLKHRSMRKKLKRARASVSVS